MTSRKALSRVGALILLTLPTPYLWAQSGTAEDNEIATLREELAFLSARLQDLESKQATTAETAAEAEEKLSSLPDVSFGKKGVIIESADKDYKFRFDGVVQTDARFYPGTSGATDSFLVRRVRPSVRGTLFQDWDFRAQVELAGSSAPSILDAFIRYTYSPELRVRIGNMKTGVGLERLQSPAVTIFNERGLASNLTPTRDLGIQLEGEFLDKQIGYQIGLFNGAPNNANPTADLNDPKTVSGRIFFEPWVNEKDSWLQGLGFGFAGSYGNEQNQGLPTQRSPGQLTFFQYNAGTTATGTHYRLNPQLYYFEDHFGIIAEAIYDNQQFGRGGVTQNVGTWGWSVSPTYVIHGGTNGYGGVKIGKGSALSKGGIGAWMIGARSAGILIGSNVFDGTAATQLASPTSQVRQAINFGGDISWYPEDNLRFTLSYDNTNYSQGYDRPTEHAIIARAQVAF